MLEMARSFLIADIYSIQARPHTVRKELVIDGEQAENGGISP